MTLPPFWRQAAFSVVEAAKILSVPEDTLRTWMARCPFNDFLGAKNGGRIFLSGNDIFFWSIVRDLSAYGVGLRIAMHTGERYANASTYGLPNDERLVVRKTAPDTWNFELVDDPDFTSSSALVIPLRALAIGTIERLAAVYVVEGA